MNDLQQFIQKTREHKSHLLMTHVVYGYPTIDKSLRLMQLMLDKGVELLEVQFPFSDPVADGPTITVACHHALAQRPELSQCIKDISALADHNPKSKVLLMSYLNPLLQIGFEPLAQQMSHALSGIIIPDLPIDHASMLEPLVAKNILPIWLITPDMSDERISKVVKQATGMLYCVSRSGVTGQSDTDTSGLKRYLDRVRAVTSLPLGVGFGINTASDVQAVSEHADIVIIGSAFLNAFNNQGEAGVIDKLDALAL